MITRNCSLMPVVRGLLLASLLIVGGLRPAEASIAYGSINNFDTVNDTGGKCHGFEIEIEDIHSADITYTYDWNHYGTPRITEDNSNPLHPRVYVRYESKRNPDGSWAAFTAVPAGPISPTDGHQFTNPSVNFGGEHFGVGFRGQASAVRYSWLKDDGAGRLVFAGAVNISTPAFIHAPAGNGLPAQVQAVIVPPAPPEPPRLEFGVASWVKETRTETHNNRKVELRDLVSDDPDDPADRNWKNGEPDEVEVEWELFQTDFKRADGGGNGKIVGAPEALPRGDEVITRRYDFFKYVGPVDAETGEALVQRVGPDGIHGSGIKVINGVETDLSTVVVVGEYVGAQMAGFDPAGQIGLIDHLQSGEVNVPYINRSIVIGGAAPIITTLTGNLPAGMRFDVATGLLSGTPSQSGAFTFDVHSVDAVGGDVTTRYTLNILGVGVPGPTVTVAARALPAAGGLTAGAGEVEVGSLVTLTAEAAPGYVFANWTDGGTVVSMSSTYQFTAEANRDLIANFRRNCTVTTTAFPGIGGTATGGGAFLSGDVATLVATPHPGYRFTGWSVGADLLSTEPTYRLTVVADVEVVAGFVRIHSVTTGATPAAGGTTTGSGTYDEDAGVTVTATALPGYRFLHWTESGVVVSTFAGYAFVLTADRDLVAQFEDARTLALAAEGQLPAFVGVDPVAVRARVTVRDETGLPLADVRVRYVVSGPNATSGEVTCGADGSAVVSYDAVLPGLDTLTASIVDTSISATLTVPLAAAAGTETVLVAADGHRAVRAHRLKVSGRLTPSAMRALVTLSDPAFRTPFRSRSQNGYQLSGDRLVLWGRGVIGTTPVTYRVEMLRGRRGSMSVTVRDAGGAILCDHRDYQANVKITVSTPGRRSP